MRSAGEGLVYGVLVGPLNVAHYTTTEKLHTTWKETEEGRTHSVVISPVQFRRQRLCLFVVLLKLVAVATTQVWPCLRSTDRSGINKRRRFHVILRSPSKPMSMHRGRCWWKRRWRWQR